MHLTHFGKSIYRNEHSIKHVIGNYSIVQQTVVQRVIILATSKHTSVIIVALHIITALQKCIIKQTANSIHKVNTTKMCAVYTICVHNYIIVRVHY